MIACGLAFGWMHRAWRDALPLERRRERRGMTDRERRGMTDRERRGMTDRERRLDGRNSRQYSPTAGD